MTGEKNRGVTISRTLIPTLPAGHLSRKHLFPLIDNEPSGTTFVIAPAGFGKSSLVAEWAGYHHKGVIWMTVANGDTLNEMSAMFITATRQVIPHFAPWFEEEQPLRPTEVVRRWGNELLQTGREFVFVLDNLRSREEADVDIEVRLIEQFPRNLHFVALRQNEIEGIYATCASRGPIKLLTHKELRFSDEEIERYAINSGVKATPENLATLSAAHGWPSATSLLRAHIQADGGKIDISRVMGTQIEPLRAIAVEVIQNLDSHMIDISERLSVLEEFSLDEAEIILGDEYSFELISSIAHRGEIFTLSRNPENGYVFSPLVRAVLLDRLQKREEFKREIHARLITYFESAGRPSAAIDHAFAIGDTQKITELFPNAARAKQAQGKGGDLLRWANFAGDSSDEGVLKVATVKITGHLADLDFSSAQSEITRIRHLSSHSPLADFYQQFADGAQCYIFLSLGKFDELEILFQNIPFGEEGCYLGIDDQINILRAVAVKRYIYNDSVGVEEIFNLVQKFIQKTNLYTSHTVFLAIQAMHLHQRGEYRRAFEIASIARDQIQKNSFVGLHGPLDVNFVISRCLLEFARPQEALLNLEKIRATAFQWKQWHWYINANKHIVEHLCYNNNPQEGLKRVKQDRDFVATFEVEHGLNQLLDLSEMVPRRRLHEYDQLEKLVNRAPDIRHSRQFKMAIDEYFGRKRIHDDAKNLPENNPRDLIWKHLTDVSLNIDSENIAFAAMQKAMSVGAEVGARETFLRQREDMAKYIIKVANEYPTVYNEEIASAMAERIKERAELATGTHQALTKRELEILRQLLTGRTLTIIAGELHISQNTLKTHLKNLYRKLEVEGRHEAISKAKNTFLI